MSRKPRGSGITEPEDRALWEAIAKTVKPLKSARSGLVRSTAVETARTEAAATAKAKTIKPQPASPVKPAAPKAPPLAPLDRRTRGRVARGRVEIDARLDLHGLTLERAHARLASFLASAQARGASLVLVITGKGGSGALRRETPFWLASPEMRPLVIGFEEAAPAHGGAGALYVRIRRLRAQRM
jgi:DNA-nicking Smr family endonuclease